MPDRYEGVRSNRWVRGLAEGEERFQKDWQRVLFWSVNGSLGLEPGEPDFIVRIEAHEARLQWDSPTMELINEFERNADIYCDEACFAMSKCGHAYSLDERIRRTRGVAAERIEEWRASWPVKTAQLYVCTLYLFSIIAKFRVTGWEWFADGQRVQSLLLKRSIMWGATESGHAVDNVVGYWIAHQPALCFFLGIMTLVMEAGFPLILLMSPRWRLFVLSGVVVFQQIGSSSCVFLGSDK